MNLVSDKLLSTNDRNCGSKHITVLGATGSVGTSTLDLVEKSGGRFTVRALTANTNVTALAKLAIRFRPQIVVIGDEKCLPQLRELLTGVKVEIAAGESALCDAASLDVDMVIASIVGVAGLRPTLAAIEAGNSIGLANKECLVSAGTIFMASAKARGVQILPVDSEHCALFQIFDTSQSSAVEKLTITASGGPFRTWDIQRMENVTPAQALRHPNWDMGPKISIDSATMMNKGLEIIEASHLFPVEPDRIDAVIHPQSIVHGLVTYVDGSTIAQLASADMRGPIGFCLDWPNRRKLPVKTLDLTECGPLTFEKPDFERFKCLQYALDAMNEGGGLTNILNAANECAVAAFLKSDIGFLDIARTIERTLDRAVANGFGNAPSCLQDVLEQDARARTVAREIM
ncbi:MAG: 1-deoxy-D-xylulose-5-phosphate reductoisomerase [Cohaesibacteraceae bacterium]|nr:1-deoxy-D-xylulose-5-phosphate reductoisomerase [Cohaesibacteraceae bacterium]MBL4875592.1 1-deoxy-D-xylulose-5-phosphate reductoisomerase [Cohaesibacteraceae bacterium]